MDYRYRVRGKVEKAFVLRGMYFYIGKTIQMTITEKEISFVKENVPNLEVTDLKTSKSMPVNSSKKGVQNEPRRTSKSKHKEEV